MKVNIYICISLLILFLIYLKLWNNSIEGFENLGYLYGSWIGTDIPVTSISTLQNGSKVYMAQHGPDVKMVTDKGEAKYFKGNISSFNPNIWMSYTNAGDGYKYKAPIITASPTDIVSPVIQLKVPSKNNLCMDDGGVTKAGEGPMHSWICDQNNKNQQFIYNATIKQLKNPNKNNLCVDDGGGTTAGATKLWMYTCDPNNPNQQFVYDSNTKMFKNPNKNNLCIDDGGGTKAGETKMHLWNCDSNNPNQKFVPVPIITYNRFEACPRGYKGPEPTGKCKAGWSTKCGEDCAKNNCAIAEGKWIPLDYSKNPYTCQMKMSPSITYNKDGLINTGLQCYLDATRKESAQGQVWKDISGNGRDFRWNKTPLLFNGKYSTVGNVASGPNGDKFGLGNGSKGYSIILYSKTNSLTQGHAFLVANNNSVYGLNSHIPWTDNTVYFDQGWSKNNSNASTNRIQKVVGPCSQFSVWAFVRDSDASMKIYKDGVLLVSNSDNSADPLELKASPWQIAVNMDADISKFMVYNTYLTASDVSSITKWIFADEQKQKVARMREASKLVPDSVPVKLGLQLYLDTSNYIEGSKEWKDQSGNHYDFTWNAAPKVVGKSFLLNGEYALSNKASKLINIDDKDTYTICWTAKTNSLSQNSVFTLKGNHLNNRGIFCHPTWTDNNMYFDQAGCCDPNKQRVSTSVAKYSKEYTFYSIRRTDKERSIFINGVKAVSIPTGGDSLNINLDKMSIGRDLEYNYTWFANLKNFMVYNRDLSDKEIQTLHSRYFSKYEFVKGGYSAADMFCKKQGKKLCKASEYCENGKPIYNIDDLDILGAIGDYPDGWIKLGKNGDLCKTSKQNNLGEAAVLCCDIKYVPLVIDAIHLGQNNTLTFFKSDKYQTIAPNKTSRVENIKRFSGLTSNFKDGNIDAITISNYPNVSLWFCGKYMMVYDDIKKSGISETSISTFFHNLPNDFKSGKLDAIACSGPKTEYILLKGTRYCIVDMNTNNFINAGVIGEKYTNLPSIFKMGFLDTALYSRGKNSFLMKNNKLVEYNFANNTLIKGPVDITSVWPTLLPPFISKDKACSVYETLMKSNSDKKHWKNKYYKGCKRIAKKEYDANLNTYIGMVNKYRDEYIKESGDRKNIELEIAKYEKLLEAKKLEMNKYEKELETVKNAPCPPSNNSKKKITVYESDPQKYYEIHSKNVNTCFKV